MKKHIINGLISLSIFLSSCSVSKKISRSAKDDILNNKAFVNAHIGISIFEPSTGKFWYNYQGERYFVPASNTKLATCYAALKYLGDSLTGVNYDVLNDSTIVLKTSADPTFLHSDYLNQPVYDFLKNFRLIQILKPEFTNFLGRGWAWDDYKDAYMAQRSSFPIYGNIAKIKWINNHTLSFMPSFFAKKLVIKENLSNGFEIIKSWDQNDFTFINGNEKFTEIPFRPNEKTIQDLLQDTLHQKVEIITGYTGETNHIIHSQPTDSLLKPMMHRSDNFFAEQSLLMVSTNILGEIDDRKIIDTLLKTDYKLLPQKPQWVDGSGLSRYNLFSPRDFVFILNKMINEFGIDRIKNILPTGGTGTINSYYRMDKGYIFVKTGTLNGVVALSGFLYTRKNKLLIFSVLVNNHQSTSTSIRNGIEKFIQNIIDNN
ncbi:MAG: D-alanyl-D-alanine carboxypeptidase [Bacteroidota bacterium]|nr:D-alanyl-D-alanine carboxypeptidase [Bacteroidota bacterium]